MMLSALHVSLNVLNVGARVCGELVEVELHERVFGKKND